MTNRHQVELARQTLPGLLRGLGVFSRTRSSTDAGEHDRAGTYPTVLLSIAPVSPLRYTTRRDSWTACQPSRSAAALPAALDSRLPSPRPSPGPSGRFKCLRLGRDFAAVASARLPSAESAVNGPPALALSATGGAYFAFAAGRDAVGSDANKPRPAAPGTALCDFRGGTPPWLERETKAITATSSTSRPPELVEHCDASAWCQSACAPMSPVSRRTRLVVYVDRHDGSPVIQPATSSFRLGNYRHLFQLWVLVTAFGQVVARLFVPRTAAGSAHKSGHVPTPLGVMNFVSPASANVTAPTGRKFYRYSRVADVMSATPQDQLAR